MGVVEFLGMLRDLRLVAELAETPPRAVHLRRRSPPRPEARERGRLRRLRRLERRAPSPTSRLPERLLASRGRLGLRRQLSG